MFSPAFIDAGGLGYVPLKLKGGARLYGFGPLLAAYRDADAGPIGTSLDVPNTSKEAMRHLLLYLHSSSYDLAALDQGA
jgi:hypothetical protein